MGKDDSGRTQASEEQTVTAERNNDRGNGGEAE